MEERRMGLEEGEAESQRVPGLARAMPRKVGAAVEW